MKYQILTHVDILKPSSDCSNNGASSKANHATLLIPENISDGVHEKIRILGGLKELAEPLTFHKQDMPVFVLVKRIIRDTPYFHAEPVGAKGHTMFGGNFLSYSGNGFRTICGYPIAIHDRIE
jgi:hypothetical protein